LSGIKATPICRIDVRPRGGRIIAVYHWKDATVSAGQWTYQGRALDAISASGRVEMPRNVPDGRKAAGFRPPTGNGSLAPKTGPLARSRWRGVVDVVGGSKSAIPAWRRCLFPALCRWHGTDRRPT
jgi:hypothetical protein